MRMNSAITCWQAGPTSSAVCRTPGVGVHVGDLLPVGSGRSRWSARWVGAGHHIVAGEDLHHITGGARVQALPDQPPRHGIECLANLRWRVHPDGC